MKRFGLSHLQIGLSVAAAAALLLVAATSSQSQFFSSTSSSGACIHPVPAAYIIIDEFSYLFNYTDLESNTDVCQKVCEKTHKTCVHAVKRARRCLSKFAKDGSNVLKASCRDDSVRDFNGDAGEEECVGDTKDLKAGLKEIANDGKDVGRAICDEFKDGCKSQCGNDSPQ